MPDNQPDLSEAARMIEENRRLKTMMGID